MDDIILIIAMLAMLAPFGVIGLIMLLGKFMGFLQVRSGKVRAAFITESFRWKERFIRPVQRQIKAKGKSFEYKDKPGYVAFQGGTTRTVYNEKTMQQINLADPKDKPDINPDHVSDLMIRAFNLGKLAGMKPSILVVVLAIIAIAVSAITMVLVVMQGGQLSALAQNQAYLKSQFDLLKPALDALTHQASNAVTTITTNPGH